jgi:hypothetical protein
MLPDDAFAIVVEVQYFDHSIGHFIGNDSDKYVDVKWDAATKQLLMNAKKPDAIGGIND